MSPFVSRSTLPILTREPNVVPMIDVLLVLLIIFMVAATPLLRVLELQLPQDTGTVGAGPSIVLSVDPGPRYALNGGPVAPDSLAITLARTFRDRPSKILFIRGGPRVPYATVLHAFDVSRGAGVRVTAVVPARP